MTPTRLAVIDDHRLLREAVVELLGKESGLQVVAAVGDVESVEPYLSELDVLLLDLNLPRGGAFDLMSRLKPIGRPRVIVVSMHQAAEYVRASFAAGANGYVFKDSPEGNLLAAVKQVAAGRTYVDPRFPDIVELPGATTAAPAALSDRERAVLVELAAGLTYKAIGEKLGIGPRTVETYRRRIAEKLGLRTRADFLRYASGLGWLREAERENP